MVLFIYLCLFLLEWTDLFIYLFIIYCWGFLGWMVEGVEEERGKGRRGREVGGKKLKKGEDCRRRKR